MDLLIDFTIMDFEPFIIVIERLKQVLIRKYQHFIHLIVIS